MIRKNIIKITRLRLLQIFIIVIFATGVSYIFTFLISGYTQIKKSKKLLENTEINKELVINKEDLLINKTERMLQIEKLKKKNEDVIGWIEIEGTNINYPVMQTIDNEYYMTHNFEKEYSKLGSIFLDKDCDWKKPSTNLLIYGHNNKNRSMFQNLMNYKTENYYKEHPNIRLTTLNKDAEYEIIAAFYSKVYKKEENNVFRYYYFINANNEAEFNYYVNECKKKSIYDTGKTARYGEQILTLSTCSYHTKDGRFALVAREKK